MLNRPNRLVIFGAQGISPYVALDFITRQYSLIIGKLLLSMPALSLLSLSPLDLVSGCCENSPDMVPYMLREVTPHASGFPPFITGVVHEFPVTKEARAKYGKAAVSRRNTAMADFSDFGIAVYTGKRRGTHDMVTKLVKLRKPVAIVDSVTGAVSFC